MLIITIPLDQGSFQAMLKQHCKTYNTGGREKLPNIMSIKRIAAHVASVFLPDPILAESFQSSLYANGSPSLDLRILIKDRLEHDRANARDGSKAHDQMQYAPPRVFVERFALTVNWTPETKIGKDDCFTISVVHRRCHAV